MRQFLERFGLIIIILFIAAFLRFYHLSSVPPSPSLDEVSIGYNAYSILKTGKDEYNTRFPILLRAYDDWRPALYVYFVIPFVSLFGLTATAVRFPSVIFSLITIFATYLIAKEIFTDKNFSIKINSVVVDAPLVAALLLSISPWHIYISRLGHEVNFGLTCVVLGMLTFLRAVNNTKERFLLIFSAFFFGASFYAYQSEKVVTPVLVFSLLVIFRKQLYTMKKEVVIAGIIGILLTVPVAVISLSPEGLIRFTGTSAFRDNPLYQQGSIHLLAAKQKGDIVGIFMSNRRIVTARIFLNNYLWHFNLKWLFLWGPSPEQFKVPELGFLYLWEAPLILLGIIFIVKKFPRQSLSVIMVWLLSAPLPAAITTGAPHAMRSYTMLPVWQLVSTAGFFSLMQFLKNRMIGVFILVLTVVISMFYFYPRYFIVFPQTQSDSFQYALAKSISYTLGHVNEFDKIIFSNKDNSDKEHNFNQSYMFFLFFSQYDPKLYQNQGGTKSGSFDSTHAFGKFEFRPIRWEKEIGNTLYIGNMSDFPPSAPTLFTGANLDGKPVVCITKTYL